MASFMAGMNPAGVYNAPAAGVVLSDSGAIPALGDQCEDFNGNRWVFVSASTSITSYTAVNINFSNVAQMATETLNALGGRVGVVGVNGISAGSYGWAQIYGVASVNVLSTCSSQKVLYGTATPGSLDDSGTTKINGIIQVSANATVPAVVTVMLNAEPFPAL